MRSRSWIYALLIGITVFLSYVPSLRAGFIWDDDAHITQNHELQSLHGLSNIWLVPGSVQQYYPLTYSLFWIEFHIFGLHPSGYHVVNVIFHIINTILLALLLFQLEIPGAWLAAILFGLHPVEVETVAWISELKNLLSAFFFLNSLLCFMYYHQQPRERRFFYGCALLFFGCAMLSKSITCTLPLVILLLIWAKFGHISWRNIYEISPFAIGGLFLGTITALVERIVIGADGLEWHFSLGERFIIAGKSFWFYTSKLLWPHPLMFVYPRWDINHSNSLYFFPLAVGVMAFILFQFRAQLGRLPLAAFLIYGTILFPALGFVNFYPMRFSFVADHFQYLASTSLIACFAAVCSYVSQELKLRKAVIFLILILVCVNLGMADWTEEQKFTNDPALWLDTLEKNPGCAIAHHQIGIYMARNGLWPEALIQLTIAEKLNPNFEQNQLALAYALGQAHRWDQAIPHYYKAVQLGVNDAEIYDDFGMILMRQNRPFEATCQFRAGLKLTPQSTVLKDHLRKALRAERYSAKNSTSESRINFTKAVSR